jgi:hypothetical protein
MAEVTQRERQELRRSDSILADAKAEAQREAEHRAGLEIVNTRWKTK